MPDLRGLYAITDDQLLAGRLLPAVELALAGGCRWIQYRSKSKDKSLRIQEAQQLLSLCHAHRAQLLINDDVELALATGADGVHLGQDDMPLPDARRLLGSQAIIGITCHNDLTLAQEAQNASADYVAFGRFFPSSTKQSAPLADVAVLRAARTALTIPVVAIGGITLDNAPTVLAKGAHMLAVVGDLFSAQNITARAQAYAALFDEGHFD